jgi:hypothetical protein
MSRRRPRTTAFPCCSLGAGRSRARVGDAVTVVGFGCTDGVLRNDDTAGRALKASDTRIIDPAAALHDGSALRESDLPMAPSARTGRMTADKFV